MPRAERWLALFLQVSGVVVLTALVAVVMPFSWMDAAHDWLGLGPLPEAPIVAYLARSASALYAALGVLYVYLGRDVRRYAELLRFLAWVHLVFGVIMFAVDVMVGMPPLWVATEGPFVVAWSLVVLALARRVR